MRHLPKTKQPVLLVFLILLSGCALPSSGSTSGTVVNKPVADAAARPARTDSSLAADSSIATDFQRGPTSIGTASWVSYQLSAGTPATSSDRPVAAAPLPESAANSALAKPASTDSSPAVPEPSRVAVQPADPVDAFYGKTELSVEQLVVEVQARNPSLQAATAAWQAAAERYPQAVSLDDPMFTSMITPTNGLGADNGGGWMVQASQKIPWAGKRALRGSAASAEADAMQGDIGDTRLRLTEATRAAFYDYYLARREMDVNNSTRRLLREFREIASQKYQVNQATEQDVLQADVELANLESRRAELTRDEQVAIARINTFLHREPDHPLPPPPVKASMPDALPSAESLQHAAIHCRPDLYAAQARVRAEEANLALACKEYYPDVNLVARYDGFMPENMRPAIGMDVNIPIRNGRRSAAVQEAENRIAQRRAEYQDRLDQVRYEVQAGLDRATQSARVVHLYEEKILPAAQRSLDSAVANYTTGKLDFLRLLDAERQLYNQREMYYQAIAEYHRRLAELERAVGEPLAANP